MAAVTLEQIREGNENVYPVSVLERCETALLLFAGGFHGAQDGIFVADAGLAATCVDIRPGNLAEMADVYPDSWEFIVADAYEFALKTTRTWDVVSVDCPSDQFALCASLTGLWCDLARRVVVLGTGVVSRVTPPAEWRISMVRRRSVFAGGVFWTVLERC